MNIKINTKNVNINVSKKRFTEIDKDLTFLT